MSKLAMMRSVMLPDATDAAKESKSLRNRKYQNKEARDYAHSYQCNTEVLAKACSR
jgi:hypothetical protein